MSRNNLVLAIAGALVVASGSAAAATKTGTLPVQVAVNANCLLSVNTLTFAAYDGTAVSNGQADIKVRCSNQTPYTVKLGTGGGTFAQRLLSNNSGSHKLEYNLYTASNFTTVWGDGTSTTGTVGDIGAGFSNAAEKTHTVFGQIPNSAVNQGAPTGTYNDSVSVTVEY